MTTQNSNVLTIVRIFDASREKVWKYWTEPEYYKKWWGPKLFTCPFSKADLRVGGRYHNCMRGPDGKDYWSTGTYKEIIPPGKLIMTDSFADEKGNIVTAEQYGMKGIPQELEVAVTLEELGVKTKMTLSHAGIGGIGPKMRSDMEKSWGESFDKLEENLK